MKICFRGVALVGVTLLLSLTSGQFASCAEARYFSATDAVSAGSEITYSDLALQFAPGLGRLPVDGSDIGKIAHLGGSDYLTTIASPKLGSVERVDIIVDGKPGLLLMFDFGQADDSAASVSILALYDMSQKPRLLDVMDVGLDRETSFVETSYLHLSHGVGMALVRNSHHNAGEEYLQTSMIGIWGKKLHEVDTVFSMSWATSEGAIQTLPDFTAVTGESAFDLVYTVRETRCDGGCEPNVTYPSTMKRHSARYRWDAASAKFVRPAHAFDKIPLPDLVK